MKFSNLLGFLGRARRTVLAVAVILPAWCTLPAHASPDGLSECSSSEDCDDGLFCNGSENCENGSCTDGAVPCSQGQTCNEEADFCSGDGPNPGLSQGIDLTPVCTQQNAAVPAGVCELVCAD